MSFLCKVLVHASLILALDFNVPIEAIPPVNASDVIPKNFLSLSIESSSFPDFGGLRLPKSRGTFIGIH